MNIHLKKLSEHVTLRISLAQRRFLDEFARNQRISQGAALRRLIDREAKRSSKWERQA